MCSAHCRPFTETLRANSASCACQCPWGTPGFIGFTQGARFALFTENISPVQQSKYRPHPLQRNTRTLVSKSEEVSVVKLKIEAQEAGSQNGDRTVLGES